MNILYEPDDSIAYDTALIKTNSKYPDLKGLCQIL